ncbi:AMP-binding protein [Nonomuraea gerenzanensis]|uniref:Long-chain-fatty-acid--CoA ligase n=1 Tax=Nonomuraea gerenzanensis TaxID=93944 RepID=A0A1M4EAX9_9ACTN|nr:AMP-binding protein [Nonomuraea gerenzanensis]UBU18141.1 AMP-binding protein [Nonomuraea gerenzanensis]SBO95950.1 Long-chain-fatty-acid--CoA ligase [Nonomuraea gerenzanensis]
MLGRLIDLGGFGIEAASALIRNGLLGPVHPSVLARVVEAYRHFHLSPATGLAAAAARWPDRPAVIDEAGTLTFAELDARAAALAAGLHRRLGIEPGRTVAVMWPNDRGFAEVVAAVSRLGADLLLLNTGLAGPRLRDVLRRERVHALIADPGLPHVDFDGPWTGDLDGLIREGGSGAGVPSPRRAGRLVLLTSGTTGVPKGAPRRLSPAAVAEPFLSMLATVPVRGGEPMLIAPPLFHGLGLLWYAAALVLGCPVVLMRRFDPEAVLDALERHRAGTLVAVPVMLKRLLACTPRPLPHLRVVVSGGSALRPDLATAFMNTYGDVLYNLYGSTEAGWAALATPADLRTAPDTVGRPPRGATVRIEGPDGRAQPAGQVGRVLVGGGLTFGAGGGPDGLLATGDLGHRDRRGLLFIDGRDDDMIVSGGENVFPQEVENVLARVPGVADVAVLGVPDEEYGQRLAAYVVAADGARLSAEELRRAVKESLAGFKVPRDVEFVPSVPRNPTGKVDRDRLVRG